MHTGEMPTLPGGGACGGQRRNELTRQHCQHSSFLRSCCLSQAPSSWRTLCISCAPSSHPASSQLNPLPLAAAAAPLPHPSSRPLSAPPQPADSRRLTFWRHLTQAPHTPLPPLHHPDNAAVGRQPVQQSQGLGRRGRHGSCILPRSVLAKRPLTYGIGSQDSNRWMRGVFTSKTVLYQLHRTARW